MPTGVPAQHRRRAPRPAGLLAAAALVAAVVGGGSAALVGEAYEPAAGGSAAPVAQPASDTEGGVGAVVDAVRPSVVEIRASSAAGQATGSGVIITEDGEILTNNHVVSGADRITVTFSDGSTASAEVTGTDPDLDMALLEARGADGLQPATLGDSDAVGVGDQVVAIGSPEGLTGTVTSGIISAKDREVTVEREDDSPARQDQRWPFEFGGGQYNGELGGSETTTYKALQTDASLNPGNSGGPLFDLRGEVVGINSAMYDAGGGTGSSAGSAGLGFAIPVDAVQDVLDELRAGG
ncbi:trypsin-like peptidase domain-containing protein [Streptomyces sp. JJ36]|nr:trypsin-like peptidase domain-containing protein [Streptomyces sp. JJ36]